MTSGGLVPDPTASVAQLTDALLRGERHALARLLTLVERGDVAAGRAAYALPIGPDAHVIGVTGPPGVGKSTLVNAVTHELRARGHRVGILAVDPSSPLTGGALLGDRVRMNSHSADDSVFIRSLANRGQLGGLATAVPAAVRLVAASGFDVIVLETVGVGQSEVAIAGHADTTVVVSSPGGGDSVQAGKAGLLEIADLMVVNKADRDGAAGTGRDLRDMLRMRRDPDRTWRVPVLLTRADLGEGVPDLVDHLVLHRQDLVASQQLETIRSARSEAELRSHAAARLLAWLDAQLREGAGGAVRRVRAGQQTPASAADDLLAGWEAYDGVPISNGSENHGG